MNKFFAMLKDSFKEAVDGWIFLVMLALAGLIILLVLSTSAVPVTPERAVPQLLTNEAVRVVSPDKGTASRQAQFFFFPHAFSVVSSDASEPWSSTITFRVSVESSMFGGMEVDEGGKQPTKPVEGAGMLANAFKEASRYWAAPVGTPAKQRPKYTDELGAEFLKSQLESATALKIKSLKPAKSSDGNTTFDVEAEGMTNKIHWPHTPSILFGAFTFDSLASPLGKLIYRVENTLLNGIGAWVLMLAGVIVTAGFIPNMLRKGSIDLLISKPISRPAMLLYKYLGGLLFVFMLCVVTVGGVWVVIGLRTGVWSPGVLASIFGITFYFAILYACSTLFGVLSRNAIVCIVVTIVFWFLLYLIGLGYNIVSSLDNLDFSEMQSRPAMKAEKKDGDKKNGDKKDDKKDEAPEDAPPPMPDMKPNPTLVTVMKILNTATPRLNDVDALTTQAIAHGLLSDAEYKLTAKAAAKVDWGEAIGVSAAWIAMFLGLATLRFVTRSY